MSVVYHLAVESSTVTAPGSGEVSLHQAFDALKREHYARDRRRGLNKFRGDVAPGGPFD
jgi:hypothetical protein